MKHAEAKTASFQVCKTGSADWPPAVIAVSPCHVPPGCGQLPDCIIPRRQCHCGWVNGPLGDLRPSYTQANVHTAKVETRKTLAVLATLPGST